MEKEQDLLEDEVYPAREDVPAELWGRPIPKVRDYEDSNPRFHMATGAGYDDFHPNLAKEKDEAIDLSYEKATSRYPEELTVLGKYEEREMQANKQSDNVDLKYTGYVPDYKFNEADILDSIQDYIDATYEGHYNRNKFQATEFILDSGHGTGFCVGNIMKYAQRYGKKGTHSDARKDLLKIVHYAIIALHNHDEEDI